MMKKRAANFTSEEKNELLDAVLRYRDVLFGRVGLPSRFWAAKKAAWCSIVDAVNQVRPTPGRNVHECRRKLKDLKAATRKKFMDVNGVWKDDVDLKDATPEELKILKLLGNDEKPTNMDHVVSDIPMQTNNDNKDEINMNPEIPEEAEIVLETIPMVSPVSKPISSVTPNITVVPQTTLKVEPLKRPVGQAFPLTVNENTNMTPINPDQGQLQGQDHIPNDEVLNLTSYDNNHQSPTHSHNLSDGQVLGSGSGQHRRGSRSNHDHVRPLGEFAAPLPLKRIKLFVRNVPTLNQPSTSVGPTASGNVLNFAICPCNKHAQRKVHDVAIQTEHNGYGRILMEKMIDTQNMTAQVLNNLDRVVQLATSRGMFEENHNHEFIKREIKTEIKSNDDEEEQRNGDDEDRENM
ncbi:uncharacterized protein [Atheta coriaria]|uniref:uncharacterized protein isoform X2 n=1 Tax=Dalotia coriaria TaxID=877792 RepID=UPI0031F35050